MPDPIAYADVAFDWPIYRRGLIRRISEDSYHPSVVEVVDLPKDRLMVRPLARLQLHHRIIYEAAIYAVAPVLGSAMPAAVYSYRWWNKEGRLLAPTTSWIKMQRAARRFHERHRSWHLARADVTAFYEYIDIDMLIADISAFAVPDWAVDTIQGFLSALNSLNNVSGIPQGPDASGILANLYLRPVDLELKNLGLTHYRYSDDMLIFGRDWIALRDGLLRVNRILRGRRLSLSSSKTAILDLRKVGQELEDIEKDAIQYGIRVGLRGTIDELRRYFDKAVARDAISGRDIKYSLTQLRKADDPHAVAWVLDNIAEIPHLIRESLTYLGAFHGRRKRIARVLSDSLVNSKLVYYPSAQQHLLNYLMHHKVSNPTARAAAWKILDDGNQEGFVREFAARYLGVFASTGDGARLQQAFRSESDPRVKRALLVACYESGRTNHGFLTSVMQGSPELKISARYLLSGPEVPLPVIERS